ncbi:hypothetical protein [Thiolinea disciformis]|uniref:hypothetical protein n=1 Tax=Thiolinea disciformis TaxID=125614 RepID=UPI00037633B4|nr:hypothetical protein [Thiolinea disciformis]
MKALCIAALVVSSFLSQQALAACVGGKTLFFCNTKTANKQIELCDAGKTINYSFGKKGKKPELAISIPRAQASTYQWSGVGRWMSYSVDVPNNGYVYNVFWGVDRITEEHAIEAGVTVTKGDAVKATIYCQEKGLVNNLEGVKLKAAQ